MSKWRRSYVALLEAETQSSSSPFTQWADTLADDQTLIAGMHERLLHHAYIVQISGDSYRLKDKRKAGRLRAPKAS